MLKGGINSDGHLIIYRVDDMKCALCPYLIAHGFDPSNAKCGDECALFGEPEYIRTISGIGNYTELTICGNQKLFFEHFSDMRRGAEK